VKETFRQSMAWLHTWAGLLVGWILFFVFVTGSFGYVNAEIDRWMKPELPMAGTPRTPAELVPLAERWLRAAAPDARTWYITLPGGRDDGQLSVAWSARPVGDEKYGKYTRQELDPATGAPATTAVRDTGGGDALYAMHYELHYMPYEWGIRIVGACAMFMLLAILSGIVTHKKIFKDFFTFRPAKGQRSWLDGHNLLSVTALPFHLMITWSGLLFYIFTYMPLPATALYPDEKARDQAVAEAYGYEDRTDRTTAAPAPLAPLPSMVRQAEARPAFGPAAQVVVENPGRADARVDVYPRSTGSVARRETPLRFNGVDGRLLDGQADRQTATGKFVSVMYALHEGRFAGPVLRALYVASGLAGAAMVATGLLLWSAKRKARLVRQERPSFGIALVDRLNLGTIIGLPFGIAVYFWANRLIPAAMPARADWEIHALFLGWGFAFLHAVWRPVDRAWVELCTLAAMSYGLLPILNALTTHRHLGVTLPAGDWVLASIDLAAVAAGSFFAFLAWTASGRGRLRLSAGHIRTA
jgi:uncharacterized iron-regulated membrane protein